MPVPPRSNSAFTRANSGFLSGQVDGIGAHPSASAAGRRWRKARTRRISAQNRPPHRAKCSRPYCLGRREQLGYRRLAALGHRVVHGGMHYSRPARVTPELLAELEALVPLAPLHEPINLAPIKMAHTAQPWTAAGRVFRYRVSPHRAGGRAGLRLALFVLEEGIRRYGFHGLSYEYIASVLPERAPEIANGRVVVAHLGNGCSACALRDRVSIATTMGFTALDGLPMGTRCGELDAGVVLHLHPAEADVSRRNWSICCIAAPACLGFPAFHPIFANCWRATSRGRVLRSRCSATASPAISPRSHAALGGLDGVVFTAGVGENAAPVRAAICQACAWLGLELDEAANREHKARISTPAQPGRRLCHQDRRKPDDRAPRPRAAGKLRSEGR